MRCTCGDVLSTLKMSSQGKGIQSSFESWAILLYSLYLNLQWVCMYNLCRRGGTSRLTPSRCFKTIASNPSTSIVHTSSNRIERPNKSVLCSRYACRYGVSSCRIHAYIISVSSCSAQALIMQITHSHTSLKDGVLASSSATFARARLTSSEASFNISCCRANPSGSPLRASVCASEKTKGTQEEYIAKHSVA